MPIKHYAPPSSGEFFVCVLSESINSLIVVSNAAILYISFSCMEFGIFYWLWSSRRCSFLRFIANQAGFTLCSALGLTIRLSCPFRNVLSAVCQPSGEWSDGAVPGVLCCQNPRAVVQAWFGSAWVQLPLAVSMPRGQLQWWQVKWQPLVCGGTHWQGCHLTRT